MWSLLAAVGLFVVGGSLSVWHGVTRTPPRGLGAEVRFVRLVFVGPKQLFLVASVDLQGNAVESRVAETLRRLETHVQADPYIVDAVLTIAEPDDLEQQSIDRS
ncbi:hypothetical protein AU191_11225 [Mycolicibacterium acapulense]|nr:hypothetical protein AU191_11225 [Mycolicibacterium acapulense]